MHSDVGVYTGELTTLRRRNVAFAWNNVYLKRLGLRGYFTSLGYGSGNILHTNVLNLRLTVLHLLRSSATLGAEDKGY